MFTEECQYGKYIDGWEEDPAHAIYLACHRFSIPSRMETKLPLRILAGLGSALRSRNGKFILEYLFTEMQIVRTRIRLCTVLDFTLLSKKSLEIDLVSSRGSGMLKSVAWVLALLNGLSTSAPAVEGLAVPAVFAMETMHLQLSTEAAFLRECLW